VKKLLLTAFEPFAGESINPSLEAARQISRIDFPGVAIEVIELPVERYRSIEIALGALRAEQPHAIVMLGERGGGFRVNPERVAINVDDFRIPDNAGNKPVDEPVIEGGPTAYFSSLPIRAITERLIKAHIPAKISDSAGTYLCNRLFYSVMHHIAVERLATIAGFIHLPYLHEQTVNRRLDFPSMARETIVEAVRLAVEVTLNDLHKMID
jgi:pyroglutamyl-peptidase